MENYIDLRINTPWNALELLWNHLIYLALTILHVHPPNNKKKGKN